MELCGRSSGGKEAALEKPLTAKLFRLILIVLLGRASIGGVLVGAPRFVLAGSNFETVVELLALRRFLIFHTFHVSSSQFLARRNPRRQTATRDSRCQRKSENPVSKIYRASRCLYTA
jgi:hypothetical protein